MIQREKVKKYSLVCFIALLCVFGFAYGHLAQAADPEAFLLNAMVKFLYYIFKTIVKFMIMAMNALDYMLKPELFNILKDDAIAKGWELVRDFVNLFFVIILLFVAICTILQIEAYSAKRMLTKVLLAALLINFSKPITLFIIDISNLAMSFFANNIIGMVGPDPGKDGSALAVRMADKVGMAKAFAVAKSGDASLGDASAIVVPLIAGIVFMFIFGGMILVLALSLILRIVAFCVLLVLSPLAFTGAALPGTPIGSAWHNWMRKMTGWAFFGPTLMFFLWLALNVLDSQTLSSYNPLNGGQEIIGAGQQGSGGDIQAVVGGIMGQIIPFAVAIYFLYYGYDLSKSLADQAGKSVSMVMGTGERHITKWAKRVGYASAGAGALGVGGAMLGGGKLAGSALLGGAGFFGAKAGMDYAGAAGRGLKKRGRVIANKLTGGAVAETAEKAKERNAATEARWAGGSVRQEYERNAAYKKASEWDRDIAPTDDELKKFANSRDPIERKAAWYYKAKKGDLKSDDKTNDFKTALEAAGDDEKLKKKIRDEAEKKNLKQVLDYDAMYNTSAKTRQDAIDNAIKAEQRRYESENNGADMPDAEVEKLRQKFEGLERGTAEYKQMVYDAKLHKMKLSEFAEQKDDFHNAVEFSRYMGAEMKSKRYTAADIRRFVNKSASMNANKKAAWQRHKIYHPSQNDSDNEEN